MHASELTARQQATHQAAFLGGEERAETARQAIEFLDRVIPLRNASHAEVACYVLEVPMRYAECFAILQDGRKVGFRNRRRFRGWSKSPGGTSYLFLKDLLQVEMCTDSAGRVRDIVLSRTVRSVPSGSETRRRLTNQEQKYIGLDGSLISAPARRWTSIRTEHAMSQ